MADQELNVSITGNSDDLEKHAKKAADALSILTDLIGVKIPESVQKAIGASELLGPALEEAFAPLAVIALIEVVVELGDKIKTVSENLAGWTQDVRDNYNALLQENEQIVKFNESLTDQTRRLNEIGHSGSTLLELQIANEKAHRAEIEQKIIAYGKEAAALHQLLEGSQTRTRVQPKVGIVQYQVPNTEGMSDEEINKKKSRLGELEGDKDHIKGEIESLREELETLNQVVLPSKGAELGHTLVQESISAGEKRLAAERDVANKSIELERSVTQNKLLTGQISDEEAAREESKTIDERYQNQVQYLNRLLALLAKDPEHNKERMAEIHEQLKEADLEHQKALLDQYNHTLEQKKQAEQEFGRFLEQQDKQQAQDAARQEEAAFQKIHKMVEELKEIQGIREASAREHAQALTSLEQSGLDFRLQIGKISQSAYENQMRAEVDATYDAAKKKLEAERDSYEKGTKEYAKAEAELLKLTDKYNSDVEKLEQKSYLRRRQQFDQQFKQISSAFNNALNGWIQGTETAGQAFGKMFQDILMQLAGFIEQWIEQKIEMWLMDEIITQKGSESKAKTAIMSDVAQIEADAFLASAEAYAANAYDPLQAGVAAGEAFDTVSTFGAGASSMLSGAGGIYRVPFDTVAMIHRDEQVLPAPYAQGLRELVNGGGTSPAVHVHVNVSAMDSASFQQTISKHGHMIGEQVYRVLRKRRLSG